MGNPLFNVPEVVAPNPGRKGGLTVVHRFSDLVKDIKVNFTPARVKFIAAAKDMFEKVKAKVVKPRKYPVREYAVWGTNSTMRVAHSIREELLAEFNGGMMVVPQWIAKLMNSKDPRDHAKAQAGLSDIYVKMAGKGWHSALPKRMQVITDGPSRKYVLPMIDRPYSEAFKTKYKVEVSAVTFAKVEIEVISEALFLALVERFKDVTHPTKTQLNRFISRMRKGGIMMSEHSLKRELHVKYPKLSSYTNQPLTDKRLNGVDIVVVPAGVGFDGNALTLRRIDKELDMSMCIKMMGIGRPGKSDDHLVMDLYHHDCASTYTGKKTVNMSYNLFKRLPLADRTKAINMVLRRAANYKKAWSQGGRLLARLLLKVEASESEMDRKQAHTAVHLASILYIVKSSAFGSMRHLLLTMMYPMIKKILFRMEVPGSTAPMVEDPRLKRNEIRVPKDSIHNVGDTIIGWGQPMFIAMMFKVVLKEGDAFGLHVADMVVQDRDGDGDIYYTIPVDVFGPLFDIPWAEYKENTSWVVYKGAPIVNMNQGLGSGHKAAIKKMIGAASVPDRVEYFNRIWQELERIGVIDTKEARFFMRDVQLGLVQPAIAGKKHDTKYQDVAKSVEAVVALAKTKWSQKGAKFLFHERTVAEYICSKSLGYRSDLGMVFITDKDHPLIPELEHRGWAKWRVIYDKKGYERAKGWQVDINKAISEIHKDSLFTNPYQKAVFDSLEGIELGAPRNVVFEQSRSIIANHPFLAKFSSAVGVNPRSGSQAGMLINDMLTKWRKDKDAGNDMNTSQQDVDEMIRERMPVLAKQFGVSEYIAQIFTAMCFMSYTSTRLNGMYGGMFAFDTRVIWTAGRLCDGSWLRWLAGDENRKEKKCLKEFGVPLATIDVLVDAIKAVGISE